MVSLRDGVLYSHMHDAQHDRQKGLCVSIGICFAHDTRIGSVCSVWTPLVGNRGRLGRLASLRGSRYRLEVRMARLRRAFAHTDKRLALHPTEPGFFVEIRS